MCIFHTHSFSADLCPRGMGKRGMDSFRKGKEISDFTGDLGNNVIYRHIIGFGS